MTTWTAGPAGTMTRGGKAITPGRRALWMILGALLIVAASLLLRAQHQHRLLESGFAGVAAAVVATVALLRPAASAAPAVMAPLIAIIGCDGSGKSTLATDLVGWLAPERPVALCYLGLGSGEMGERIKRWPLVGPALEARLARKAAQTRTTGDKIPGAATALVVFAFSLARRRRFRRMLALRRRGVTVVTDRYPQTEVPGFYDGPGLSAARATGPFVAWLAARERRMYQVMAGHHPDLVLRLNVDADTAWRRKPEHRLASLRAKVAVTPTLRFDGASIVELDSLAPYERMSLLARRIVRATLSAHAAGAVRNGGR